MELHGGSVAVHSAGHGAGSEFTVRLPLTTASSGDVRSEEPEPRILTPARLRVLIADDNEDAADSLAMLLSLEGCEVRTAYDGRTAVSIAQLFRPQVALLDIGMPELDGYDTAQALRQQRGGAEICLIAITGRGQEEDKRRTDAAGFAAHLTKPVDSNSLRKLLSQVQSGSLPSDALA
jgi:CheY-like chemotaxis protein